MTNWKNYLKFNQLLIVETNWKDSIVSLLTDEMIDICNAKYYYSYKNHNIWQNSSKISINAFKYLLMDPTYIIYRSISQNFKALCPGAFKYTHCFIKKHKSTNNLI